MKKMFDLTLFHSYTKVISKVICKMKIDNYMMSEANYTQLLFLLYKYHKIKCYLFQDST